MLDINIKNNNCPLQYLHSEVLRLQKENPSNAYQADRKMWDFRRILDCNKSMPNSHSCIDCMKYKDKEECWNRYLIYDFD